MMTCRNSSRWKGHSTEELHVNEELQVIPLPQVDLQQELNDEVHEVGSSPVRTVSEPEIFDDWKRRGAQERVKSQKEVPRSSLGRVSLNCASQSQERPSLSQLKSDEQGSAVSSKSLKQVQDIYLVPQERRMMSITIDQTRFGCSVIIRCKL